VEPFHLARGYAPFSSVLDGVIAWGVLLCDGGSDRAHQHARCAFQSRRDPAFRHGLRAAVFRSLANATLLPWLETNLAITRINAFPGFFTQTSTGFGAAYGAYKDRNARHSRSRLISEEGWWPSVAIGAQDPFGTSLFPRQFAAATKTLGDAQVTLGYGRQQIDGAFGGLRYSPSWAGNWSLVSEYDASDYKNFPLPRKPTSPGAVTGFPARSSTV